MRIENTLVGPTRAPAYIVFDLGSNDASSGMTSVATVFDNAFAAAVAAFPSVKIIVFRPATPQGSTANLNKVKETLKERAATNSLPFIDAQD